VDVRGLILAKQNQGFRGSTVPIEASTTPVGQQKSTCCPTNWPVSYGAGLQLIIRHITLFGQWPTWLEQAGL